VVIAGGMMRPSQRWAAAAVALGLTFHRDQELSSAQQQAWLNWSKCIRGHGLPNFPDPTFPGGRAVQISGPGASSTPQLQSAMAACKSQMPSTGGLGG
jgi:hypothetical protein